MRNSASWICSGVPAMVTWRSCEPSSKSAIFMFAPDACLHEEEHIDGRSSRGTAHLISEIFWPPRPIIQPIRSLAMVISRCVCKGGRLGGRPFGSKGAASEQKKRNSLCLCLVKHPLIIRKRMALASRFLCQMPLRITSIDSPADTGTPGASGANGPKAFN